MLKNENLEKEGKYEKGHANVPFLYSRKTEQEDIYFKWMPMSSKSNQEM